MGFSQSLLGAPKVVISYGKNQISAKYRYIERCPNINFSGIISDTKGISNAYRIFHSGAKTSGMENVASSQEKRQIYVLRFTILDLDNIQISKTNFKRISVKSGRHFVARSPS